MICKNQACKADFCWVCLGPWEPHGSSWYNCNRYDEDEAKAAREGQEKSRSALQRYLFYCNRYMNHLQSLKFENKLYTMVKVLFFLISIDSLEQNSNDVTLQDIGLSICNLTENNTSVAALHERENILYHFL